MAIIIKSDIINGEEQVSIQSDNNSDWEIYYSKDYEEGVSGWKQTSYKGKYHSRNDEPSWISYYRDGTKTLFWDKEGKCHRLTGPAWISCTGDKEYYIEDEYYDYEDWLIERKKHPDWKKEYENL